LSHKHFGVAVGVAGLFTGLSIAPGEVEDVRDWGTEISGYNGSDLFGAPSWVLAGETYEVAHVVDPGARYVTSSSESEKDSSGNYVDVPSTKGSNSVYDGRNSLPILAVLDQGNFGSKESLTNAYAHASVSTPAISSRALTRPTHRTAMLPLEGCARCAGQAARAFAGRAKSFSAMFSINLPRKGGSIQQQHPTTGIRRQRQAPLLTASILLRGWRNPSL
jgi:hypothetical protein